MSGRLGFRLHPLAARDITEIWEYIFADSPSVAGRVRANILSAIRDLVPFPHRGHKRADLTSRPLRFWRVYNDLIAYAPDERPLWVLAVLHGNRSPQTMAAILRDRELPN